MHTNIYIYTYIVKSEKIIDMVCSMLRILACHRAFLSLTCIQPRCYSTTEAGLVTAPPHPTSPQVMEARRYGLRRRASATEREAFSGVMAGMTCMLRQTAAGCPPVGICYRSRAAGDSVCVRAAVRRLSPKGPRHDV